MSDVTFNEEQGGLTRSGTPREPRGLYKLAIKLKLAKDEEQAKLVLIFIAVLAIAIAIIYPMLIL